MINEYERWGFSKFRKLISFLQILGACGLLLGLYVNFVLIISSLGLSLMMFSAIIVRIYINDNGRCSLAQGQGNWNIEALGHDTFDFGDDMNHAHVQPNGAYHYHGMPELLMDFLGDNKGMTLVGWASDGFPVYAQYAYSNPNNTNSSIVAVKPSYKLKDTPDENRPSTLTTLVGGPGQGTSNLNIPIPMGAFTQDYEYIEGYGDLDECNGRVGVTPEFPNGIYYYMVTDEFPFFSRCLKGNF